MERLLVLPSKRILYVTQWYDPEPAFKGATFVYGLIDRGYDVDVLTAFPNYPRGKIYSGYSLRPFQKKQMDRYTLYRVFAYPSHDRSSLGRVFNYASFFFSCLFFGLFQVRNYDAVLVYHPPIMPAFAASLFAWFWRKPMVLDVQDLWPDSVMASGMGSPMLGKILNWICDFVYRRSAAIIVQSDGIKMRLIERGVPQGKLTRIYNWATYKPNFIGGEPAPNTIIRHFEGRFNFVYGGNLGQAQGLESLIDAVKLAYAANDKIRLHLIGEGISKLSLKAYAEAKGAGSAIFHDAISRPAMDRVFDQADVLVLQLKADPLFSITVPSKLQHYLACGKPIIGGLQGEAAEILQDSKAGTVVRPEDREAMAGAMVQLSKTHLHARNEMGRLGRLFCDQQMSFPISLDHLDRTIKAILP